VFCDWLNNYQFPRHDRVTLSKDKGKGKKQICTCAFLNRAPSHEGVLGEWKYSSTHSLTSTLGGGEWIGSLELDN
jgi:hypothetical protein